MKFTIGFINNTYPEKRNIINKVKEFKYIKVLDWWQIKRIIFLVLRKINIYHISDQSLQFIAQNFNDFNLNRVTLLHFFNNISYGETPWISTFETFIPRYPELMNYQSRGIPKNNLRIEKALEVLASDNCKKLIAISNSTKKFQLELLNEYPKYKKRISDKIIVIYPPQEVLVNLDDAKTGSKTLSFLFVGRLFFRKGGLEILKAFVRLYNETDYKVKLTIISTLTANDDATLAGESEVSLAQEIINRYDWITYYEELPNERVLDLMKEHDIGLLPTWADTFGYSVLEMQASGCPVITTDVRALPEINNEKTGWIINVPKTTLGEAKYATKKDRKKLSESIEKQLYTILVNIFENRKQIAEKRYHSLIRIHEQHSPKEYARKLKDIYVETLN